MLDGIEPHWIWVAIGLALAITEILVPGVFLIWLAVAAVATGLLTFLFGLPLSLQVVQFVAISLVAVYSARRFLRDKPISSSDPLLNNRMGRLVGETAVITEAIVHGTGRVHLGDSDWTVRGPEMAAGERVRITGNEGSVLIVEPLVLLSGEGPKDGAQPPAG